MMTSDSEAIRECKWSYLLTWSNAAADNFVL
jgi:hypothetical protein